MAESPWKVLLVDDEPEFHQNLKDVLASRMGSHTFEFTTTTSFDQGITLIQENRFDLIFLDVNEKNSDPNPEDRPDIEDQRGEELLRRLKELRFVPVIFYTGFPAKVDHLKSPVVKVVEKGAPITEIRDSVNAILSTKLLHLSRHIEEQSRVYLWESLENIFNRPELNIIPSDLALLTARNLAHNLSQQVIKQLLELAPEEINPLEMYQFPPKGQTCNPADIYIKKDDQTLWIVLTPACDFEQNKADNVLLAEITPLKEHDLYKKWETEDAKFNALSSELQRAKAEKKPVSQAASAVKDLVKGRKGERYKFLPGTFFLPDCIIDFQALNACPQDHTTHFDIVCSLDSPYREEILHLFSKYYGRIGTPDYNFSTVWEKIDANFKEDN